MQTIAAIVTFVSHIFNIKAHLRRLFKGDKSEAGNGSIDIDVGNQNKGNSGNVNSGGGVQFNNSGDATNNPVGNHVGRDQIIGNTGNVNTGSGNQMNIHVEGDNNKVIGTQRRHDE